MSSSHGSAEFSDILYSNYGRIRCSGRILNSHALTIRSCIVGEWARIT